MRASPKGFLSGFLIAALSIAASPMLKADDDTPILKQLTTVSTVMSIVPTSNGDVNPYGIVRIENTVGKLEAGNILVSNFNNSNNVQGNRHHHRPDFTGRCGNPIRSD